MEIYNLYSLDIFFQGLFLLFSIGLGVYLVFKNNLETFKNIENIRQFSDSLNDLFEKTLGVFSFKSGDSNKDINYRYFGLIPLIIAASFILGILGNGLADSWIDSPSNNHLELKALWGGKLSCDSTKSKKALKYKNTIRSIAFKKVFNVKITNDRIYEQLYYQSKNELITHKYYYNYIRKSQAMAEYSRTFALGFFFLMVCGFLNLLLMIVRVVFGSEEIVAKIEQEDKETKKSKKKSKFKFKRILNVSNSVFLIFSIFSFLTITFFLKPEFCIFSYYQLPMVIVFVYFGSFTFLLFIFRKFKQLRFSFFIYSIIYVISFVGYFVSAKMWIASEKKVASKVYGIYKTRHTSDSIEEIKYAKDTLHLNVFPTLPNEKKDITK